MAEAVAGAIGRRVSTVVDQIAEMLDGPVGSTARREARDLVAAVLDVPRFWPSLHGEREVGADVVSRMLDAAHRRASGAPFAYAVGRAAFRHLTLDVDDRVLIPRQETEQLVEVVLSLALPAGGVAIDVGTGSGAIALALATEGRFERIVATDISLDALAVARRNVARCSPRLRCPVELRQGALLAPAAGTSARLVVSNPPYIAHREAPLLPLGVRNWEPPVALYGGDDGVRETFTLAVEAIDLLEDGGMLAVETDTGRAARVADHIARLGAYTGVRILPDLTGRDRFVLAQRRGASGEPQPWKWSDDAGRKSS